MVFIVTNYFLMVIKGIMSMISDQIWPAKNFPWVDLNYCTAPDQDWSSQLEINSYKHSLHKYRQRNLNMCSNINRIVNWIFWRNGIMSVPVEHSNSLIIPISTFQNLSFTWFDKVEKCWLRVLCISDGSHIT